MANKKRLQEFLDVISKDLDRTVDFWLKHSHDEEYGGFFNCLGRDGKVYDELKYGWLQGRQVWTYARLYNEVPRFKTNAILQAAEQSAEFMMKHMKVQKNNRCYFITTREGHPVKLQHTIFTESFYMMAMSELGRATGKQLYKDEAVNMLLKIEHWVRVDNTDVTSPPLAGNKPTNNMAIPMITLSLINQLEDMDQTTSAKFKSLREWCIPRLLGHIQRDGNWILENVSEDGKELPGCQGRLTIPGHAIEGGWFLLEMARRMENEPLKKTAIETFMVNPFNYGWDEQHGGLFYFVDADGLPPAQLEWNMKLWWPHNEAMIAFLMAYQETDDEEHLDKFAKVFDYSYKHFCDPEHGEWYGYLSQEGKVNMDYKGAAFKGCFHVPRCLMMCEQILAQLLARK